MKLKFSGHGPGKAAIHLADLGVIEPGMSVVVGEDRAVVLLQAYPDAFKEVKSRAKSRAVSAPPASRAMEGAGDGEG